MDTLGTACVWAQHVERCCANALDFFEPHMGWMGKFRLLLETNQIGGFVEFSPLMY